MKRELNAVGSDAEVIQPVAQIPIGITALNAGLVRIKYQSVQRSVETQRLRLVLTVRTHETLGESSAHEVLRRAQMRRAKNMTDFMDQEIVEENAVMAAPSVLEQAFAAEAL